MKTKESSANSSIKERVINMAKEGKGASIIMANIPTEIKNKALIEMANALKSFSTQIEMENDKDINISKGNGLSEILLDRLIFNKSRIESRYDALMDIASLPDPVGSCDEIVKRPSGLIVKKVRQPIGLIGMIYESRPHVTVNAGALCLKSGNAVLLKGGSETLNTNIILGKFWKNVLKKVGLPPGCIQVIDTTDREAANTMLTLDQYIDLIVPRGGGDLIKAINESTSIPVLKHYHGICHLYIDHDAALDMAVKITVNSKVLMPEVCNALETLLVHKDIAPEFLPGLSKTLKKDGVEIRGCPATREIIKCKEATDDDWHTEYLDLILSIKVVSSVDEAIIHINEYGSHHTDAIVSNNHENIRTFETEVDSGVVLINASTMFCDGREIGMGAEIGISTDRLHARGPVGMRDLTTYKYVIEGQGHIMK